MEGRSDTVSGAIAAVPIVLGYLPIAFSFGVAATRAGLSGQEAVLLSVLMYSGAAQFVAIALIVAGAPFVVGLVTLSAMSLRHILYAPSLMRAAGGPARFAPIWGFGLTDEVFGAALGSLARGQAFSARFMGALSALSYAAWVVGTMLGARAGAAALQDWPIVNAGLDFMLTALFLALLLSILQRAQAAVIAVAGLVTALGVVLISPVAGLLAGMVAGAAVGVLRGRDDPS